MRGVLRRVSNIAPSERRRLEDASVAAGTRSSTRDVTEILSLGGGIDHAACDGMIASPPVEHPIGPVTKHAILGVVLGLVVLPIWSLTGQFPMSTALIAGFGGGLVGGTTLGLVKKYWLEKSGR